MGVFGVHTHKPSVSEERKCVSSYSDSCSNHTGSLYRPPQKSITGLNLCLFPSSLPEITMLTLSVADYKVQIQKPAGSQASHKNLKTDTAVFFVILFEPL